MPGGARRDPSSPTFSVIICSYNREHLLPRALATVLAQTCTDFELVVVDDGSTDGTRQVVEAVDDERVRYVRQDNAGLSVARNTGVAHSAGTYVVFLDDDDVAFPTWLERFAASLDGSPAVVSCGEELADDAGHVLRTRLPGPLGAGFADYDGWFLPGTFVVRRDAYEVVGGFRPGLPHMHQTEFALRLLPECLARGWEVHAIAEPLVRRHVDGDRRRGAENTRAVYDGIHYVLTEHHDQLARSPWLLAQYSAVAGVAAARIGDYDAARSHLLTSVRANPREWKHWARLALAVVPPAGKAYWNRQTTSASPVGVG